MREQQIPPGAVIKIDTEGFEPLVMEGLAEYISVQKPILFFEWSQNELKATATQQEQSLLPDSYCCYLFISHIPHLFFFERQSYGLQKIDGHWPDGMILAFDTERLQHESFKTFIESKTTVAGK